MIFLPDAENRTIVSSFIWTKHRNVTDGQTDGQPAAITAVCIASNAECGRAIKKALAFVYPAVYERTLSLE